MILEKLTLIFRTVFEDESIILTEDTSPDDIPDWDSLSQILLIEEIEKLFHVQLELDEVFTIHNIKDMINIIEKHL